MNEPLFFKPVFKERIWGGTALRSFGYDIPVALGMIFPVK